MRTRRTGITNTNPIVRVREQARCGPGRRGRALRYRRLGRGHVLVFLAGCAVSAVVFGLFGLAENQTNRRQAKEPAVPSAPGSAKTNPTTTNQADVKATNTSGSAEPDSKPKAKAASAPPSPSVSLPAIAVSGTADGFDNEALATAQSLADRYPNRAEALHVLALLQAQIRHSAEADRLWRRCVELAPGQDIYLTNLAANAINRGDSEGAIEVLQQIVAKGKASPDAMHNLAASLMNVGRVEEALKTIEDATNKATNSPAHWLLLGQIQLKLGQVEQSEASTRKAITIGGETATSVFTLASALARQGKKEEAAQYRQRHAELSKREPISADNRYQVLSEAESRRNLITVLVEGGAIYGKTGDLLKAEIMLLRALALEPRELSAALALADIYVAAGMYPEERVVRRRILDLNPNDFDAYLRLAKSCVNAGDTEAGAGVLKNALALAPDRIEVYASLAQLYLGDKQPEKALFYAQEAVARQPSREGYQFVANVWKAMGNTKEAAAAEAKMAEFNNKPRE